MMDEEDGCPVCLESWDSVDEILLIVTEGQCGHSICKKCADSLQNRNECPMCRGEIVSFVQNRTAMEVRNKLVALKNGGGQNNNELQRLKAERDELQKRFEQMQSELDAIKRSKQEKDDEISRIREELQLQSRRNEALAQRELELQQQLRDVRQKDSEAAKALIAQIEAKQKELEQELALQKEREELLRKQHAQAQTERQLADQQLKQLMDKYALTQQQLISTRNTLYEYRAKTKASQTPPSTPQSPSIWSWASSLTESAKRLAENPVQTLSRMIWSSYTGPLVCSNNDFEVIERRGCTKTTPVFKARVKHQSPVVKNQPRRIKYVALKTIHVPPYIKMETNTQNALTNSNAEGAASADQNSSLVEVQNNKLFYSAFREAYLLHKFEHPNIIKISGITRESDSLKIVMMFVEDDLAYLIDKECFSIYQVQLIMKQILSAIAYLHSQDIVHRDINPSCILVKKEHSDPEFELKYNIMLAGFTHARSLRNPYNDNVPEPAMEGISPLPQRCRRNRCYWSPELIYKDMEPDRAEIDWKKVDVWAAGCILLEMLSQGRKLVTHTEPLTMIDEIASVHEVAPPPPHRPIRRLLDVITMPPAPNERSRKAKGFFDPNTDAEVKNLYAFMRDNVFLPTAYPAYLCRALDLLSKMLQFEPSKRCTADEALEHAFLRGIFVGRGPFKDIASDLTDTALPRFVRVECGGI